MRYKTLCEVCEDSPCGGKGWCFLREYFLHLGSDRNAMQIRLMIDYRFVLGKREHREFGDKEAFDRWIVDGLAERYAAVYDENKSHEQLKKDLDMVI